MMHYYDIPKEDIYTFLLDMCQSKDWVFAMAILMNARTASYFSDLTPSDKSKLEMLMHMTSEHELTTSMIKSYYDHAG
jgi:hypothetical protein